MNARRVEIGQGIALSYLEKGQGTPLILLHAFPLSAEMWRAQIAEFSTTHRVIAPDLRGFGQSAGVREDETPSIPAMARDLDELLQALGVEEEIILCGLSMGGYIALAFAREYSQRLRGLVLCNTRADADSAETRAKRNENIAFLATHSSADFIERMIPNLLGETTRRENSGVVQTVRVLASAQNEEGCRNALRALRDRSDRSEELSQIAVPTLIVGGSEDVISPPNVAREMAARMPNARCEIIEGAGHLSNLENANHFTTALREFLRTM